MSTSAESVRFSSGRYIDQLFGGLHGEMQPDPYSTFVAQVAHRARSRRLELGLETDDVARRITEGGHKLKGASLENWERGDLPLKYVGRLAEALEMDWRELLGVVQPDPRREPVDLLAQVAAAVAAMVHGQAELHETLGRIEDALSLGSGGRTTGSGQ